MDVLLKQNYRIVFIDECHFTGLTMLTNAFALKGQNITLDEKKLKDRHLTLVAAVSKEHGLEAYLIFETNVDSKMFLQIVPELKSKFGG